MIHMNVVTDSGISGNPILSAAKYGVLVAPYVCVPSTTGAIVEPSFIKN
jgi:hypothetical protein